MNAATETPATPALTIEIAVGANCVTLCITKGAVEITTAARWADKAEVFAQVLPTMRAIAAGMAIPTKVVGRRSTRTAVQALVSKLLTGLDAGLVTPTVRWSAMMAQTGPGILTDIIDMKAAF